VEVFELIISEIGQNFVGNLDLAKKMIQLSRDGGAGLAKFQLFDTDKLYQKGTKNYQLAKESELDFDEAKMLFDYGKEVGIEVFFSVFDIERVRWCEEIGVKRYKIAARSVNDRKLLKAIGDTRKPIIVSLQDGSVLSSTLSRIVNEFSYQIYCVSSYPALINDYSSFFKGETDCFSESYSGISDHTIGIEVAQIALARGARIIEKHFCIDHQTGVDAAWSMDFEQLKELVRWDNVCQEVLN
jgi:sialic acid synthase SpsE